MAPLNSLAGGQSDAALIAASRSRPDAFAAIFDRHFAAVHAYLARRAGYSGADDLASATFTVAFERRRSFRPEADSARPWLFGIATNLLRNQRRSELRSHEALSRAQDPAISQRAGIERIDERLASLLRRLDPDQRDVVLLYAWGELSYEEIAAALEVPLGTVRSRLARAREHLRRGLNAEEWDTKEASR